MAIIEGELLDEVLPLVSGRLAPELVALLHESSMLGFTDLQLVDALERINEDRQHNRIAGLPEPLKVTASLGRDDDKAIFDFDMDPDSKYLPPNFVQSANDRAKENAAGVVDAAFLGAHQAVYRRWVNTILG